MILVSGDENGNSAAAYAANAAYAAIDAATAGLAAMHAADPQAAAEKVADAAAIAFDAATAIRDDVRGRPTSTGKCCIECTSANSPGSASRTIRPKKESWVPSSPDRRGLEQTGWPGKPLLRNRPRPPLRRTPR